MISRCNRYRNLVKYKYYDDVANGVSLCRYYSMISNRSMNKDLNLIDGSKVDSFCFGCMKCSTTPAQRDTMKREKNNWRWNNNRALYLNNRYVSRYIGLESITFFSTSDNGHRFKINYYNTKIIEIFESGTYLVRFLHQKSVSANLLS